MRISSRFIITTIFSSSNTLLQFSIVHDRSFGKDTELLDTQHTQTALWRPKMASVLMDLQPLYSKAVAGEIELKRKRILHQKF